MADTVFWSRTGATDADALYRAHHQSPELHLVPHEGQDREAQLTCYLELHADRVELSQLVTLTDPALAAGSPFARLSLPRKILVTERHDRFLQPDSPLRQMVLKHLTPETLTAADRILTRAREAGWRPHLEVENDDVDVEEVLGALRAGRRLWFGEQAPIQGYHYDAEEAHYVQSSGDVLFGPGDISREYTRTTPCTEQEVRQAIWALTRAELEARLC